VLKHHFDNLHQQHASERLGMWMFLATEVLFFGGIFAAYTMYRMWFPHEFEFASSHLLWWVAALNTALLITSSLTMTLAIRSARVGDRGGLYLNLLVTAFLGLAFLGMKAYEYSVDFHEKFVPGSMFRQELAAATDAVAGMSHAEADTYLNGPEGQKRFQSWSRDLVLKNHGKNPGDPGWIDPGRVQLFLCFYYIMTGIHGIHILVGVGCILWLVLENYRRMLPPANYSTVEVVSLYWHLVDVIWLFLMPLLYLAGAGLHH
jgi:cytochrome c oxidase subunit 3